MTISSLPGAPTGTGPHVQLGAHRYPIYAQRIGYLENRLGRTFSKLVDAQVDDMAGFLQANAYELLRVFIPNLMPEHEFRGYASEGEQLEGAYDPERDTSPTTAEIVTAFQEVMRVNRFDLFGHLGKLVDPALLRGLISTQMARQLAGGPSSTASSTTTAPTTSTPSGTTARTPTVSAV